MSVPRPADEWRVAAIHGADVRSVAIHPAQPSILLAGTSGGQIYRSVDAGESWSDAGHAYPFPGWVIGTLAFDPNRQGRVWAGMWALWGNGGFIAFSDDLGETWTVRRDGLPALSVYDLALVPGQPGRLYTAMPSGVYGSVDEGRSWKHLSTGVPGLINVGSLLVDPVDPQIVYAGTWRRAFRSDDGGKTWNGIFEGMVLDSEVFTMAPVPGKPGELWASTCGWVYRSRNRGGRWLRHKEGLDERRTPAFLPLPDGSLLAGTVAGLYRSTDGGASWKRTSRSDLSIHTLQLAPGEGGAIYAGTEGSGVWISDDGGRSLRQAKRGMTNVRVAALASDASRLFAAVTFAGPASGVYRRENNSFVHELEATPTVLDMAFHNGHLFAATERGLFHRLPAPQGSGLGWKRVEALGKKRIEQLAAGDRELMVRTNDGLWSWRYGKVEKVDFKPGLPHSIAFAWGRLWVLSGDALYRIQEEMVTPYPVPSGSQRLVAGGEALTVTTADAVWIRQHPESAWTRLPGERGRVLATGDDEFPLLLAGKKALELHHPESGQWLTLDFPVPPRDVRDARIHDRELLLATSGYGLLSRSLPIVTAAETAVAGGR